MQQLTLNLQKVIEKLDFFNIKPVESYVELGFYLLALKISQQKVMKKRVFTFQAFSTKIKAVESYKGMDK